MKKNLRLCDEFEGIAEKCLTTPANTAQLMELKKQAQKAETETIFELEKKLFQARIRLEFLLGNTSLSPAQVRSNNQTFSWNDRMPTVFEEHRQIVAEKSLQFQEALKLKRERFIEELENATKQVDEFIQCGEMQDLAKYYKKAQQLEQKLNAANERIEQFNAEEEAFAWELTQYPLRLQAYNALQPYLKLYEIGVEFTSKHKVRVSGNKFLGRVAHPIPPIWTLECLFLAFSHFEGQPHP